MAIFGRNKDEDYEDDASYPEDSDGGRRLSKRKFKDLKPENKKKRKEPPKPWGKKERIIVLVILLVTAITSAILALGATSKKTLHLNMPKFNINFLNIFKEETIIIGNK